MLECKHCGRTFRGSGYKNHLHWRNMHGFCPDPKQINLHAKKKAEAEKRSRKGFTSMSPEDMEFIRREWT